MHDLRYALRVLRKSPAFFALAAIGTGLGAAAITTVLSVSDTALIGAMPYRDSARLVVVWDQLLKLGFARFPLSVANYLDYRAQNRAFEDIAAFEPRASTVMLADRAARVAGMRASANLLAVLGEPIALGRWFEPAENRAGRMNVVVMSHRFWRRMGAPPMGATLRIDEAPYIVAGVLREGFGFRLSGEAPEIWLPLPLDPPPARDAGSLRAIARLKPGVTLQQARSEIAVMAARFKQQYHTGMGPHGEDGGYQIAVVPLRKELFGAIQPTLYATTAASAVLLLLGLANTALLWMGRAAARRRDVMVRVALGASRTRVARQLVTEALVPSLAGGAFALLLTLAALHALNASPQPELSTVDRFTLDYRVFAFALLLSTAAGALFGALPLRSLFRHDAVALRQNRGGISDRGETRLRAVLVALQVGLSCALLAPALLLVQSLTALERVEPGFRTNGLLTAWVSLPAARYTSPAQIAGYYRRVPGTVASTLPLALGPGGDPFSIEGRAYGASGTLPQFAHRISVGEHFFDLLHIPTIAGRPFEPRDFAATEPLALVNETLARAFWPRESPVGKRILMGAPRPGAPWMTIVGIVADIHSQALDRAPLPQIFVPFSQAPTRTAAVIVEDTAPADLERALHEIDPAVPAYAARSMQNHVAQSLQLPRLRTALFTSYGLLAFALAGFGIYSVAFYAAIRRRREFAIRAALGATSRRLLRDLLSGTLRPAGVGATLGLAGAYALARAMAAFLFGTTFQNPVAYCMSAVLVLSVAALAAWLGGRGLAETGPADVLRAE